MNGIDAQQGAVVGLASLAGGGGRWP